MANPGPYEDTVFVLERGAYRKKMNIVGDTAKWSCFRIHLVTRVRARAAGWHISALLSLGSPRAPGARAPTCSSARSA
jgi:hypothetical protein